MNIEGANPFLWQIAFLLVQVSRRIIISQCSSSVKNKDGTFGQWTRRGFVRFPYLLGWAQGSEQILSSRLRLAKTFLAQCISRHACSSWTSTKARSRHSHHSVTVHLQHVAKVEAPFDHDRFEMPYNIWCNTCGNHVGMGVRYNAEKTKIGNYFTTPIFQFRMKCHLCDGHYEIKTDPKVSSIFYANTVDAHVSSSWKSRLATTWLSVVLVGKNNDGMLLQMNRSSCNVSE